MYLRSCRHFDKNAFAALQINRAKARVLTPALRVPCSPLPLPLRPGPSPSSSVPVTLWPHFLPWASSGSASGASHLLSPLVFIQMSLTRRPLLWPPHLKSRPFQHYASPPPFRLHSFLALITMYFIY